MPLRDLRPRRALAVAACAAVLASGQMIIAGPVAAAPPVPSRSALLAELRGFAGSSARISTHGIDGTATFVGGSHARPLAGPDDGEPTDIARSFVDRYAAVYGVDDPSSDLVEDRTATGVDGGTAVRFRQHHAGVPVLAGEIAVQIAADGSVLSTSGEAVPRLDVDTTPTIDAATASATALSLTVRDTGVPADVLGGSEPELLIYDPALVGTPGQLGARLVWHVDVRTALGDVDQYVLIDAHTGAVALHINQREDAKNRAVCDNANAVQNSFGAATCDFPVRVEGGPTSGIPDVNDAYDLSGATYDFYLSRFSRDSVDDAGLALKSTVRFCIAGANCPYANAFWNGEQMVYGQSYASADDVVAHELTHGLTQYTSELFYYADSGAINESMSDVMGELMDLQYGTDAPADRWSLGEAIPGGAIRNMADPTLFGDPDRMSSAFYDHSVSDNGGVHVNSGVNNKAAFLISDGGSFNGQTITGIGEIKAGLVYYQAQTTLLLPGSDYLDLFYALQQACTNLIGTSGISAADCNSVRQAVTATEMNLSAQSGGVLVSASQCPVGSSRASAILSTDFETGLGAWSSSVLTGNGSPFDTTTASSQSGSTSLYGSDSSFRSLTEAHTVTGALIPVGTPTFMRFDHSFNFDYTDRTNPAQNQYWDGGLVGYSTVGPNGPWTDMSVLGVGAAVNGYPHTLVGNGLNPNPMVTGMPGGRPAFSGVSQGYQSTRYDLSSLAGQTVYFIFQIGTDTSIGTDGWFIDDLSVYTCAAGAQLPGGPQRASAQPSGGGIAVSWVSPESDGGSAVTAYRVTPYAGGVAQAPVVTNDASTSRVIDGLQERVAYTFTVAAFNGVGFGAESAPTNSVTLGGGSFVPVGPERVFDTRPGESTNALVSVPKTQVLPGADLAVQVSNLGGGTITPASGVGAVSINVAVTNPAADGFITVYPCANKKLVASVNFRKGQTVSNAVIAPVSAAGTVCFYSFAATDLIVDINGWFPAGSFTAVGPERVFDTRPGESANALVAVPKTQVTPSADLVVQVSNLSGGAVTPASGLGAVSLNVAVTNPAAAGFVTVYPCANKKLVASVNFTAGATLSNAVIAPVSPSGTICFFSFVPTDLIVDINGWFPAGSSFTAVGPERVFDTRPGESANAMVSVAKTQVTPSADLAVQVTNLGGGTVTPATGVGAVSMNVAVTNPAAAGYVTVYPCANRKLVASVNYNAGSTVSNAVIAPVSASGTICFYSLVPTDLIVDINGWFPAN